MATHDTGVLPISIQCVDDAEGSPGVVIYDNETFALSPCQDAALVTAGGDGRGRGSSVSVFQLDSYAGGDAPEIIDDSDASIEDKVEEIEEEE